MSLCIYIAYIHVRAGGALFMKAARVFKSGNSQAVRLPKEFQLDAKEVGIFWQEGDLILRPMKKTWREYFLHGRRFTDDYPDHVEDMPAEERLHL
jgi:antitoxin VapB